MVHNSGHKAAGAARAGGGAPLGEDAADGRVDGAFHSPAFLAAKMASLQETERESWDDFKKRQLAEAAQKAAIADDEVRAALCRPVARRSANCARRRSGRKQTSAAC